MKIDDLRNHNVAAGKSISAALDDVARHVTRPVGSVRAELAKGIAFVTYAYDIDGVSMEIAKYARCLDRISPGLPIHCIAGNFGEHAGAVLDADWERLQIKGADGWDKWDDGRWFARLFYEDLEPGSDASDELAQEIWRQALDLAEVLVEYIEEQGIGVIFTVNTNSNPGNVAFSVAIVLASEITGLPVINNNHDFYWEGGQAGCKRNPGEEPGPRDHFFRNHDNEEFFGFFQRIYPWNGGRWVQANINQRQSRRLIDRFHFHPEQIFNVGTALDPEFFRESDGADKIEYRGRLARVLGGDPVIEPVSVRAFGNSLTTWMYDQRPVACAAHEDLELDLTAPGALVLLQPTRVVPRKRIWRNWELIAALLDYPPFRDVFAARPDLTLTLHVTGPVPIEHRDAVEEVLSAYQRVLNEVPTALGRRLFQTFSVGFQGPPGGPDELSIVDIFQFADLVVFPSSTEGRGLPIPESAAAGVPLVCTEYSPRAVFEEVIGMDLDPAEAIQYDEFPHGRFDEALLANLTAALLEPSKLQARVDHNRKAVLHRYSMDALTDTFSMILDGLDRSMEAD